VLELDITFTRDYYARHFGIAFGVDYFEDVGIRAQTDVLAAQALHKRLGDCGLGSAAPPAGAQLGYDDTLNVVFMFGGKLRVSDGISWVEPGLLSDPARVDARRAGNLGERFIAGAQCSAIAKAAGC